MFLFLLATPVYFCKREQQGIRRIEMSVIKVATRKSDVEKIYADWEKAGSRCSAGCGTNGLYYATKKSRFVEPVGFIFSGNDNNVYGGVYYFSSMWSSTNIKQYDTCKILRALEYKHRLGTLEDCYGYVMCSDLYFTEKNKIVKSYTSTCSGFVIIPDDELASFLEINRTDGEKTYLVRIRNRWHIVEIPLEYQTIRVTKEDFLEAARYLYEHDVSELSSLAKKYKVRDYDKMLQSLDEGWSIGNAPESFIPFSDTDNWLKVLLSIYPQNIRASLWEYYKKPDKDWSVLKKMFPDAKIVEDRMFIPVKPSVLFSYAGMFNNSKEKYIVVSKNIYDYFFCSYGSSFQSCYSLNSSHFGFYGMIPMALTDNHFIVYCTDKEPSLESIMGGSKWYIPYMYFRCWAWVSENDELLLDKLYPSEYDAYKKMFIQDCGFNMKGSFYSTEKFLKNPKRIETVLQLGCTFYPDSLRVQSKGFFRCEGTRNFVGYKRPDIGNFRTVLAYYKNISDISEHIDLSKELSIFDGKLINPKRCPITNMIIPDTDDVHWFASRLSKPVSSLLIVDYRNGYFNLFCYSDRTDNGYIRIYPDDEGCSERTSPDVFWLTHRDSCDRLSWQAFENSFRQAVSRNKETLGAVYIRRIMNDEIKFIRVK